MGRVCHEWLGWKVPWLFTVTYNHTHTFHFPQTTWLHKVVTVLFRCPLPPYRQFHRSITTRDCSLADHRTLLCAFCILGANGNFSPKRKIQRHKLSEHWGWITTVRPGWNRFFQVTKQKRTLSPYLRLTCLLLTNSGLFPFGWPLGWSAGEWYLLPVTC